MSLAVLAVLLLTVPQLAAPPTASAEAFFDRCAAEDFGGAMAMGNRNLLGTMSEDKLRALWLSMSAQAGPFRSRGTGTAVPAGNGHAVTIRATFGTMQADFIIGIVAGRVSGLSVRPAAVPSAPPPYAKADAFLERDVTVGSDEWPLPGTLSMPVGGGPFPAVVLVHGSGPGDRDAALGPNRPFRDLAHGLASRGVAVLRYEKRTRVHPGMRSKVARLTVHEETVADAALAVELLASTPGIDPARVFVAGHSLGGMLVPRIAAAAPRAHGFIVLAGPARPIEQAIVEQLEYIAALNKTITVEEQERIDEAKNVLVAVRALTAADADSKAVIGGAPASYWVDLRGYDAPTEAKAVSRRMLVLQGGRDYQVTMKDFARWQAALMGRADVEFRSYPALNHLFMAGTGPGAPLDSMEPAHVDEQVVRDIAVWIGATKAQR